MTGAKLDLILDIEVYQFVEQVMRQGVSYIAQSYSAASNEYMRLYNEDISV